MFLTIKSFRCIQIFFPGYLRYLIYISFAFNCFSPSITLFRNVIWEIFPSNREILYIFPWSLSGVWTCIGTLLSDPGGDSKEKRLLLVFQGGRPTWAPDDKADKRARYHFQVDLSGVLHEEMCQVKSVATHQLDNDLSWTPGGRCGICISASPEPEGTEALHSLTFRVELMLNTPFLLFVCCFHYFRLFSIVLIKLNRSQPWRCMVRKHAFLPASFDDSVCRIKLFFDCVLMPFNLNFTAE